MNYYGNSTTGADQGQDIPDTDIGLVLRCPCCTAEIELYGDWYTGDADTYTLDNDEMALCTCGATFGEGDTLDIVYN